MPNPNIDPLDKLLQQHRAANGETPTPTEVIATKPVDDIQDLVDDINYHGTDDVDYGDNDLNEEIKMEEQADEERIQKALKNKHIDDKPEYAMPVEPHNKEEQLKDVEFQANKLAIVTTMINKVVAKYKLVEGGVSETPVDDVHLTRMELQGELVDLYHRDGDVITPEFENMILKNWILPDGRDAYTAINEQGSITSSTSNNDTADSTAVAKQLDEPTQININIPENTHDVTVNIDSEMIDQRMDTRKINVTVTRVSDAEIQAMNIIENGDIPDTINEYDPDLNDVPVTLAASAYRCVVGSINWFNIMRFSTALSGNDADSENKKWSIIYKHIKNPSIGNFTSYEDFLKKTKYSDLNMLSWALLTASSEEEVEIELECNECSHGYVHKYSPRSIAHIDENRVTNTYLHTHNVSLGAEAIEHWKNTTAPVAYSLGEKSIVGVEVSVPSVYRWINEKIPLMNHLYAKFNDGKLFNQGAMDDPGRAEFEFMWAIAQILDSIVIYGEPNENGVKPIKQRFTNWDKIEEILNKLSHTESMILLAIVREFSEKNAPVTSYYFENVTCPKCHVKKDRLVIRDISEQLLFPISRRLELTTINLIETR